MSSKSPPQHLSRSCDFWFDDGSLILQVGSTQFCIHRSLICNYCAVFRDMHELSQPGELGHANGCPIVVLEGDTAEDWTNLLRCLYFFSRNVESGEHISFPFVASMLRLGRKYEFTSLWSLAMRTLRSQVPVDHLSSWDNFWDDDSTSDTSKGGIPGGWLSGNEIHLLNLVVDQDIQTIQPIAYYICAHRYELENILTGKAYGSEIGMLRRDALHTLLLGRERLRTAFYQMNMGWLTQKIAVPLHKCYGWSANQAGRNPCDGARTRALVKLLEMEVHEFQALDKLDRSWYSEFCDPCAQIIQQAHTLARENIWSRLPDYFNLPTWSELKDPV